MAVGDEELKKLIQVLHPLSSLTHFQEMAYLDVLTLPSAPTENLQT